MRKETRGAIANDSDKIDSPKEHEGPKYWIADSFYNDVRVGSAEPDKNQEGGFVGAGSAFR